MYLQRILPCLAVLLLLSGNASASSDIAIVGATVIDGTGRPPLRNAAVLISGRFIRTVGESTRVKIPRGTRVIDASGKFLTPGFIDTNTHITNIGADGVYWTKFEKWLPNISLRAAQLFLKSGITTIRDSYGFLEPLRAVRDSIESGSVLGPRISFAGNIVGWGGPGSLTYGCGYAAPPTFLDERIQDAITQGVGEELIDLEPKPLRAAIDRYLDNGVDFLKYGATTHGCAPALTLFSARAQSVIIQQVHRRGKRVETHATSPEALRTAIIAGVDLVQHPEELDGTLMSDELVALFIKHKVVCSMNVNHITGAFWRSISPRRREAVDYSRLVTSRERRDALYNQLVASSNTRKNAEKLIRAGCIVSVATDGSINLQAFPRPSLKDPVQPLMEIETLSAIEGLVELGMTPSQALVSATRNGAIASGMILYSGTIQSGKLADLILLDADPLEDITNIRRQSLIMKDGAIIDVAKLPSVNLPE